MLRVSGGRFEESATLFSLRLRARHRFGIGAFLRPLFTTYRARAVLGLTLMIAQAFTLQRDILHLCAGAQPLL